MNFLSVFVHLVHFSPYMAIFFTDCILKILVELQGLPVYNQYHYLL